MYSHPILNYYSAMLPNLSICHSECSEYIQLQSDYLLFDNFGIRSKAYLAGVVRRHTLVQDL